MEISCLRGTSCGLGLRIADVFFATGAPAPRYWDTSDEGMLPDGMSISLG